MPIQTRARVYDTPVATKRKEPSSSAKKSKTQDIAETEDAPEASELLVSPELGLGDDAAERQVEKAEAMSSPSRSTKRKSQSQDESAIPVQDESPSTKKQKLAVRPKKSTPSRSHKSVLVEVPLSTLRKVSSQAESTNDSSAPVKDKSMAEPNTEVVTPAPPKSKRIIFSDDEPMEFYTPLEAPAKTPGKTPSKQAASVVPETVVEAEEEEEDSDDEAPEAVSTHKAAQNDKVAQAVAKAAEQQAAEKKRKRQERDALFKQQAEVRKRAAEAKQPAEQASPDLESGDDIAAEPAPGAEDVAQTFTSSSRKRAEKRSLPSILPAEFLESDEEYEEDAATASLPRKPKKLKFSTIEKQLARDGRPPADQRVGSTVYRVLHNKADKKLAPKLQKQSRNSKEELLIRNRIAQRKKGGFFVTK